MFLPGSGAVLPDEILRLDMVVGSVIGQKDHPESNTTLFQKR
jgi:hypothetical protein